ncbi:MAG: DUF4231 domain-containing protein [Dehalococcoidia bacterium]|nr:DUF4231 domain-containing protein [Dehalococcoidia bacterium]
MELPQLHGAADRASRHAQAWTKGLLLSEIVALVLASAASTFSWKGDVAGAERNLAAAVAATGLLVAGLLAVWRGLWHPEAEWYRSRALAESVKSVSWLYAVAGHPFALSEPDADALFLERLSALRKDTSDLALVPPSAGAQQITTEMRSRRGSPLPDRAKAYIDQRLNDQVDWYSQKAASHRRWANILGAGSVVAIVAGVALSVLAFLQATSINGLGIATTVATALIAWSQLNQHRVQATSYGVTGEDLLMVREALPAPEEEVPWSQFVADAEAAFSREHTRWLARRELTSPRVV